MPSVISTQTIGSADNCIVMQGSQWGRQHGYGDNWSVLRIGVLFSMVDAGTFSGPFFRLGLCHGTVNMPGDATTDNSYGAEFSGSWSRGTYGYNMANAAFTRVGTTKVLSVTNVSPRIAFQGVSRYVLFMDITKGSPNYTFSYWYHSGNGAGDVTPTSFLNFVNVPSTMLSLADQTYANPTGTSLAVDAATNGVLDTVYCSWNLLYPTIWISALAVARMA